MIRQRKQNIIPDTQIHRKKMYTLTQNGAHKANVKASNDVTLFLP